MSVNSEMTALADAIREKSGRTEQMGIAAMKEAVEGISTGIDTSDATATATDIASGKTAYVDGQKITGNVVTLESGQTGYLDEGATGFSFSATNNQFSAMIPMGYNVLFRNGSYINAPVSTVLFGDATAADVAKGKTFTSASGLKITGTQEASSGGGLPAGISALATGTVYYTTTSYAPSIEHGLGVVPNFFFVVAEGATSISGFNGRMIANFSVKQTLETYAGYYATLAVSSGGSVTNNTQPISAERLNDYFNTQTFKPYGFFQTNKTYRWYAGVLNMIS